MLRAPALWARAVSGLRGGPQPGGERALSAGKRRLVGFEEQAATPPGRAARRSQLWAGGGGGGRGSGGGDQGAAGSGDNFSWTRNAGSCREGRPDLEPLWHAEMRSSGENWDPEHHPLRGSAAREWPGVRGEGGGS